MAKAIAVGLALLLVMLPAVASPVFATSSSSSACGQANPFDNPVFGGYCVTTRNSHETISGATMSFMVPATTCVSGACNPINIAMAGFAGCDLSTFSGCSTIAGLVAVWPTVSGDVLGTPCAPCGLGYNAPVNPGDQIQMVLSSVPGGYSMMVYDLTTGVSGSYSVSSTLPLAGVVVGVTPICGGPACSPDHPLPQFGSVTLHVKVDIGSHTVALQAMSLTEYVLVGAFTTQLTVIAQPTMVTGDSFSITQLSTEL